MAKPPLRFDLAVIAQELREKAGQTVLDVGCGDGALMAVLRDDCGIDARGIEIDAELVEKCVSRGLSVVQGDANRDLADYPDNAFDYTVLGQTLQTSARPDKTLEELLRVSRTAFISFPNFAHWRTRSALLFSGRMPVTQALPVSWYETQNIHHVTIEDFRRLVNERGARIERRWFFSGGEEIGTPGANWRAEFALFEVSR
ncbi:MAG: methionine biosynthesis protein MetW [Erythrobacter sp.]|uniref:methionine biosynthesis protein MetW n=1 Tax=Erythrobacter sp. TaxID=1042 RepID=UPI002615024D|nr:methionine biosynthesis protein MetW [Erythrobacter sp.]MDJ0979082.1 methionine biosynthesis protein MetW [Erythrobacter sp.]